MSSRVLTDSQLLGGGPQDCKPHLPAFAQPAEGWAARQAPSAALECTQVADSQDIGGRDHASHHITMAMVSLAVASRC